MKQTILGAICLSLAASIWGGMYVVSKYVLDFIPPLTLVWLRFIIAFVVLYGILKLAEKKQKKKVTIRKKIGSYSLGLDLSAISFRSCQFIGTKLSDAHTGSLVTSATPAFMVIFAALILKEKLTARRLLSTIIATIGVIIVIGWDIEIGSYFIGTIILVGAAITWALLSIYVKIASIQFSSLVITTYAIFFSLFLLHPL